MMQCGTPRYPSEKGREDKVLPIPHTGVSSRVLVFLLECMRVILLKGIVTGIAHRLNFSRHMVRFHAAFNFIAAFNL